MLVVPLGQELNESSWEVSDVSYNLSGIITATNAEYLRGVGQRFFTEFDFRTGIEIMYELLAHPLVLSETTKLFQEVTYLTSAVYPAEGPPDISIKLTKYIEDVFTTVDIDSYFQSCLAAYVTGVISSELVWGGNRKDPQLLSIKPIAPALFVVDGNGLSYRKGFNSGEILRPNPLKFLKFTYSSTIELSKIGDGVGKVLYYLLQERNSYNCMLKLFSIKGVTPTLLVKAESGTNKETVKNIARALNSADDWKAIPIPKGISVEVIETDRDFKVYEYLLVENEKLINRLVSGESIVGTDTSTGQKGAVEASNLRKSRAISLGRKVVNHINNDLIRTLIDFKFGPQASYPELRYSWPSLNRNNLATINDAIAVSNAFGYRINPAFFENNYGLDILDYGITTT
jgi:hypothetical protein